MTRIQQVLTVMQGQPDRIWTPSDVSIELRVAPEFASNPMRKLAEQGQLVKVAVGQYRVATTDEIAAFERAKLAVPVVAAIPEPAPVQAPPATEAERIIMIRTLRAQGRPMAPALIAGRLGKFGIRLARTDELLALLAQENAVRSWMMAAGSWSHDSPRRPTDDQGNAAPRGAGVRHSCWLEDVPSGG